MGGAAWARLSQTLPWAEESVSLRAATSTRARSTASRSKRVARSGASNVQPFGIDDEHDAKLERLAGRADVVLVDAPCSGTGTLLPDIPG